MRRTCELLRSDRDFPSFTSCHPCEISSIDSSLRHEAGIRIHKEDRRCRRSELIHRHALKSNGPTMPAAKPCCTRPQLGNEPKYAASLDLEYEKRRPSGLPRFADKTGESLSNAGPLTYRF